LLINAQDSLVLDDRFISVIANMEIGLRLTSYEVDPNHKFSTGDALALNTDACLSPSPTSCHLHRLLKPETCS